MVLTQTAGESVFYVADYASLEYTVNDVINLICRMYLMSFNFVLVQPFRTKTKLKGFVWSH